MKAEELHLAEPGFQLYLKIVLQYIANAFEKAISESCQIKEQNQTITIFNEEIRMVH